VVHNSLQDGNLCFKLSHTIRLLQNRGVNSTNTAADGIDHVPDGPKGVVEQNVDANLQRNEFKKQVQEKHPLIVSRVDVFQNVHDIMSPHSASTRSEVEARLLTRIHTNSEINAIAGSININRTAMIIKFAISCQDEGSCAVCVKRELRQPGPVGSSSIGSVYHHRNTLITSKME